MSTRQLVVAAVLVLPSITGATDLPPGEAFTSPFGFPMVKTTLAAIQARLGPTRLETSGDAGESVTRICYRLSEAGIVAEFLSSALGGPEHNFLGFRMRLMSVQPAPTCGTISRITIDAGDLSVGGLRLSMERSAFERRLGVPRDDTKRTTERHFERRERLSAEQIQRVTKQWPDITRDPFYYVLIVVKGTFADGRLVELEVWKTETL